MPNTIATTVAASTQPLPSRNSEKDLDNARKKGEEFAKRKLNTNHPELQGRLNIWIQKFLEQKSYSIPGSNERIDFPRFGLVAEIMARTPCRIYDLPELKMHCDTAFVDTTGRMYMSDSFFSILEEEQLKGYDSLYFVFIHEMEHNRRMHLQRLLDYPASLANIAQDIRINCDIAKTLAGDAIRESKSSKKSTNSSTTIQELNKGVTDFYNNLGESISQGCAMGDVSDYFKWEGLSEEAIAAELFKNWQPDENESNQSTEVSFPLLCEGVAQDLDAMSKISSSKLQASTLASELTQTAIDTRAAGKAKGKITPSQLSDLFIAIDKALATTEMTERNLEHTAINQKAVGTGKKGTSVSTGDSFIDSLFPIERLSALKQILEMIMNPSSKNGNESPSKGGMQIKDLDLPRSQPSGSSKKLKNGQEPNNNDSGEPETYDGDDHVMSAQKLADILKSAGVHDGVKALGYDDLDKMNSEQLAAKTNISGAINKASEDVMKLGNVYPGAHMVDYAVAQLTAFYKPVITWKLAAKKLLEDIGNKNRFEHEEPWMQYYASASDQGLDSEDDIGYMGSYVTGGTKRPLAVYIIDSSGSVTDNMLKRFASESVNAAREAGTGEASPEVIIIFADTVARGEPILITEDNFEEHLKKGINYGGRGGTNFTASVQNVFKLFSMNHTSEKFGSDNDAMSLYRGRQIDAMIYFTDTFDAPPDQYVIETTAFECGMSKLPTMLFLAPKECYSDSFKDSVKNYADCVFFDKAELEIDFEDIESNIETRGMRSIMQ